MSPEVKNTLLEWFHRLIKRERSSDTLWSKMKMQMIACLSMVGQKTNKRKLTGMMLSDTIMVRLATEGRQSDPDYSD